MTITRVITTRVKGEKDVIRYGHVGRDGTRPDPDRIVFVGTPSPWSNPFVPGKTLGSSKRGANYARRARVVPETIVRDPAHAYSLYVIWMSTCGPYTWTQLNGIAGASALACWCHPRDDYCHADYLARVLDRTRGKLPSGL